MLKFGGDYYPEQWPEEVWAEDIRLMLQAGVNFVTVGVFAWSLLEPEEGKYEFGWLDRVLDGLHGAGIAVDLATATASPPPWFSHAYPDSLPIDVDGRRLSYGSRQAFCPSSPSYRQAAARLVEQLAQRYGEQPALSLWHVHNEYACHNARCYCDTSAAAFRSWLDGRYGDLDGLNEAWGTTFWSQRYTDWAQVLPPRATPTLPNPTQLLDFRRFSSDEHLANFVAERDILRRLSPRVPSTTNLICWGHTELDQWTWAGEMDVVSTDHYTLAEDPTEPAAQTAYAADFSRSLAGGAPWLLMEHSTSAVNWQPQNVAKEPGQLFRETLSHIARGADGTLYFQWRASQAGAEKWHSAMVPHAGTNTKIFREVVSLGAAIARLSEVAGSRVTADIAILLDFPSAWAQEAPSQPSSEMTAFAEIRRWHTALWRLGFTVDLAHPAADLSGYRLVLAPALYAVDDRAAANLGGYVAAGGHLVVGPYSGIVDEQDRVRLGGYPGAFTDLLGVRVEEFFPLRGGQTVPLTDGSVGVVWSELATTVDASVLAFYGSGPLTGRPAITRNGRCWYLGTRLQSLEPLLSTVTESAGASPLFPGVEAVRRGSHLFLINHSSAAVPVHAEGVDLLTGSEFPGELAAGAVAVVRES